MYGREGETGARSTNDVVFLKGEMSMRISEMSTLQTSDSLQLQSIASRTVQDSESSVGGKRDEAGISPFAQFLNKLEQLQEKDPDAFVETLTEMAAEAREKAASATGREAEMLDRLADDLEKAAETGDISVLQPKPPEEKGEFSVSSDGIYGPKNGRKPPEQNERQEPSSMMFELMKSLESKVDKALAA